jgi:NADH-quinone oxidoreductase subunit G
MPKLTIDGTEVEVPLGTTILQACEHAGIKVAHFCFTSAWRLPGTAGCALSR